MKGSSGTCRRVYARAFDKFCQTVLVASDPGGVSSQTRRSPVHYYFGYIPYEGMCVGLWETERAERGGEKAYMCFKRRNGGRSDEGFMQGPSLPQ